MGCLCCKGRQLRLHITLFQVLLKECLPPYMQKYRFCSTLLRQLGELLRGISRSAARVSMSIGLKLWAGALEHAGTGLCLKHLLLHAPERSSGEQVSRKKL